MVTTTPGGALDEIALEVFELLTRLGLPSPGSRRRGSDLKEIEFLTLALLHDHQTMIVGDIQRLLGVLPAQMSRIIRSLEDRTEPLVACRINPADKRKVNVGLTAHGAQALHTYQAARVGRIAEVLRDLPNDVHEDLRRLLDRIRVPLGHQAPTPPPSA
jgi:DNA-binding MarR family transcriptional regulator